MKQEATKKEKSVLVVDDEATVCKSVKKILKREKLEVDEALTGKEALDKLDKKPYGVVITDMMMPGIGGMDLIKRVKEKYPEISVIMITGYATVKTAVQAIKLGAFDYIPKPFTPEELTSVTLRAIERMKLYLEKKKTEKKEFKEIRGGYYIREHSWALPEADGIVRIGVDDMFLRTTGKIINVDLPFEGDIVEQGKVCARVTSHGLKIHKIWSPISGNVVEVNEGLNKDPSSIYSNRWLVRVEPLDLEEELKNLVLIE